MGFLLFWGLVWGFLGGVFTYTLSCQNMLEHPRAQVEIFFLPAVIFIFSSGYALPSSPAAPLRNGHYFQLVAGLPGGGPGMAEHLLWDSRDASWLWCNGPLNKQSGAD